MRVLRHAEQQEPEFALENWFFNVYNSKYCNESLDSLYSLPYVEFVSLSNKVAYFLELEKAAHLDQEAKMKREQSRRSPASQSPVIPFSQ